MYYHQLNVLVLRRYLLQRTDNYFFLSGFVALGLFILFLSFFLYASLNVKKIINYSLNKNALSVTIYTEPTVKNIVVKKVEKKEKQAPIKIKEQIKSAPQKEDIPSSLSSLFDTVSVKKPTRANSEAKKIEISKEFRKSLQKRTKIEKNKEPLKSAKKITEELKNNSAKLVIKQVNASPSSNGRYNEYYAKIQALIYKHWHPSPEAAGSSAKIRLNLLSNGQVEDIKVLSYSENELFNVELEEFIARLKELIFPIGLKNSVIEIYIGAKE